MKRGSRSEAGGRCLDDRDRGAATANRLTYVAGVNKVVPPPTSMIDRMTLIIDTLGGGSTRLGVDALVRRTGLPRSTVRRILEQLVRLNWVVAHPDGYGVGGRLGGGVAEDRGHLDIRSAASRHLHRLHVTTGMVAHLGKQTHTQIFVLDKHGGRSADAVPTRVGGRAPMHATALGKAILAWFDPEDVDDLLVGGLVRRTASTITDLATLHEELGRIRGRQGVAYEVGESVDGVRAVSVALRSPSGFPISSISLATTGMENLEAVAPMLTDVARRIGRELYPTSRPRAAGEPRIHHPVGGTWSRGRLEQIVQRGQHGWQ